MTNIIISGLTAAGKTTHSLIVADRFELRYVGASMLALEAAGMTPGEVAPDFWLTSMGIRILHDVGPSIDNRLLAYEEDGISTVFDCFFLPWLHRSPALSIWLESSLESRLLKAEISHGGESRFNGDSLRRALIRKDDDAARMLNSLVQANLYSDRQPFDHILDIGPFITAASIEASRLSIDAADGLISPLVDRYLATA